MHWGIRSSVHWILDIAFQEFDFRKRKGNSASNFARVRRLALNLLKNNKTIKAGV
jgi:predicted transposase YbfD/YdcC